MDPSPKALERRYLLRRTPHAESIYFRLNDALRADKDVLEAWAPLVYVVVSALAKMPPAGLGSTRRLHRQPAPTPRHVFRSYEAVRTV